MSTVDGRGAAGSPPDWPRLADPELRSRIVGYLRRGVVVEPGRRSDGRWAWSETLAEHVLASGTGLRPEFVAECAGRGYQPPSALPPRGRDHVDLADPGGPAEPAGSACRSPSSAGSVRYFAAVAAGADGPTDLVRDDGGTTTASWLSSSGWTQGRRALGGVRQRELDPADAAELADQLCARWHQQLCAFGAESDVDSPGPRLARVFDRTGPGRSVSFSPNRLRLVDAGQRERLAAYLAQGRLVLRAAARMPDPLAGDGVPVVPLSFRTDGVWVWQEALAYYVRQRGIAPELALLCHIEQAAVARPELVGDEQARRAATVATAPTPLPPPSPTTYLRGGAGELFRRRSPVTGPPGPPPYGEAEVYGAEQIGPDLRWRRCPAELPAGAEPLIEIDEREASDELDARWAARTRAAG